MRDGQLLVLLVRPIPSSCARRRWLLNSGGPTPLAPSLKIQRDGAHYRPPTVHDPAVGIFGGMERGRAGPKACFNNVAMAHHVPATNPNCARDPNVSHFKELSGLSPIE